jgi:hypothetical protein
MAAGAGADQYLVRRGDGSDVINDEMAGAPVAAAGAGDAISQRMAGLAAGTIKRNWVGNWAGVQNGQLAGGEDAITFASGIEIGDIRLQRSGTATAPGAPRFAWANDNAARSLRFAA